MNPGYLKIIDRLQATIALVPFHAINAPPSWKKCWILIHEIWTPCARRQNSDKRERGGGGDRLSWLFVKSFLHAFRKKQVQHRNIFSHTTGRLAKFGWILTYLKIFTWNGTNVIVARSHSILIVQRNTQVNISQEVQSRHLLTRCTESWEMLYWRVHGNKNKIRLAAANAEGKKLPVVCQFGGSNYY